MRLKRISPIFKLLSLVCAFLALNACSSEPSPWTKSSSPWEQRQNTESTTPAPTAETYKADLEMPAETANEVELSYQTESVESFVPEAAASGVAAPVEMDNGIEPPSVENSIMDQPANYYTMQLMASVDIDRVIRFANENEVSTEYIVATERDGVIWHVLLLDVYPDYSSAVAARDEISPRLKNEPWIRSVGSVQKLIR